MTERRGRGLRRGGTAALAAAVPAAAVLLVSTGAAAAQCAMCGTALADPNDPLRSAIGWSVAFLIAVPFTVVGSIGMWLYLAYRRALGEPSGSIQIPFRKPADPDPVREAEEAKR